MVFFRYSSPVPRQYSWAIFLQIPSCEVAFRTTSVVVIAFYERCRPSDLTILPLIFLISSWLNALLLKLVVYHRSYPKYLCILFNLDAKALLVEACLVVTPFLVIASYSVSVPSITVLDRSSIKLSSYRRWHRPCSLILSTLQRCFEGLITMYYKLFSHWVLGTSWDLSNTCAFINGDLDPACTWLDMKFSPRNEMSRNDDQSGTAYPIENHGEILESTRYCSAAFKITSGLGWRKISAFLPV